MAKKAKVKKKAAKKSVSLLSKLLANYKRLTLQLSQLRQTSSDFNDKQLPAWEKWKGKKLSKAIDELGKLKAAYDEIADRLDQVDDMSWNGSLKSRQAAYQKIINQEQDPDSAPSLEEIKDDPVMGMLIDTMLDQWLDSRGIDPDDLSDEDYEAARDKFAETFHHAETGDHKAFEKALMDVGRDDSSENKKSIKSLYRQLAKRLHPDKNANGGNFEAELWNDTQSAYEHGDQRQLIHIDLRLRIGTGEPIEKEDTPNLRTLVDHLSADSENLRDDIYGYKRHPAWNFLQKSEKERQQIAHEMSHDIKEAIKDLTKDLAHVRAEENRLKQKSKPKAKEKAPKQKTANSPHANEQIDFPF
jgi:hypothetical protein